MPWGRNRAGKVKDDRRTVLNLFFFKSFDLPFSPLILLTWTLSTSHIWPPLLPPHPSHVDPLHLTYLTSPPPPSSFSRGPSPPPIFDLPSSLLILLTWTLSTSHICPPLLPPHPSLMDPLLLTWTLSTLHNYLSSPPPPSSFSRGPSPPHIFDLPSSLLPPLPLFFSHSFFNHKHLSSSPSSPSLFILLTWTVSTAPICPPLLPLRLTCTLSIIFSSLPPQSIILKCTICTTNVCPPLPPQTSPPFPPHMSTLHHKCLSSPPPSYVYSPPQMFVLPSPLICLLSTTNVCPPLPPHMSTLHHKCLLLSLSLPSPFCMHPLHHKHLSLPLPLMFLLSAPQTFVLSSSPFRRVLVCTSSTTIICPLLPAFPPPHSLYQKDLSSPPPSPSSPPSSFFLLSPSSFSLPSPFILLTCTVSTTHIWFVPRAERPHIHTPSW